jgi:hypothetical protein
MFLVNMSVVLAVLGASCGSRMQQVEVHVRVSAGLLGQIILQACYVHNSLEYISTLLPTHLCDHAQCGVWLHICEHLGGNAQRAQPLQHSVNHAQLKQRRVCYDERALAAL